MAEKNQEKAINDMSIDEIIDILIDARIAIYLLRKHLRFKKLCKKEIRRQLKNILIDIDLVGCELTQNIAVKLKKT